MTTESLFQAMAQSIVDGEPEDAQRLAEQALAQGVDPLAAVNTGFVPGVNEVGRGFACGEMYLPDLVRAGAAMKAAMSVLEPEMIRRGSAREPEGVVVIGTIKGDIHEIGKNLVATMFTANGFKVYDLGVDVPFDAFAAKAAEVGANLVCISALLTTTMVGQRKVVESLVQAGQRGQVKVLVGGAPVTPAWATEIGADGFAEDALGAVKVARQVTGRP
jgi:corrinoid protein of di/trimethylamine methyltransferase